MLHMHSVAEARTRSCSSNMKPSIFEIAFSFTIFCLWNNNAKTLMWMFSYQFFIFITCLNIKTCSQIYLSNLEQHNKNIDSSLVSGSDTAAGVVLGKVSP